METVQTYGPNKSKLTQILYSAISSWGGFIYQGLCAICVALEQIYENLDDANTKFLNLEGYDDFAVLDKDNQILSFHQAKCYKQQNPDFKDDMALMEDKRAYWHDKGICKENAKLYFHSNRNLQCHHKVTQYKYSNNKLEVSPTEIITIINDIIADILDKNKWLGTASSKSDAIISLFDRHVCFLDAEVKKGKNIALQLTIDKPIPFKDIVDILRLPECNVTVDDRVRTVSFYLNVNLKDRILDELDGTDTSKVERFLNAYNSLSKMDKTNVVKRLFPHFNVEGKQTNTGDLTNQEVANYLYNVLTQTEEMNLDKLHWEVYGQQHSPSTLGQSCSSKVYCGKIVKNRENLPPELLRDYRWIVGDLTESIDDIFQYAHVINNISDEDYNNISKSRKVGILTIKDKNYGHI